VKFLVVLYPLAVYYEELKKYKEGKYWPKRPTCQRCL